jgi:DNA-directed RNA polymerase subunit alpha
VLLSSLPGAAPVGVKIKGAEHEFSTLPHIKEDILEIILNIKKLRLKIHGEEAQLLELSVHGKKTVTAADIKKNAQAEIINQDLEICQITDMSGSFTAEISVALGMGYETVEARESSGEPKKEKEIGFIEMDSIFTPILKAGIKVENVRVGKMTNWDKLVLDIETDGTITPEQAFKESVDILIEQFQALIVSQGEEKEEKDEEEKEESKDKKEDEEEAAAAEKEAGEDKPKKKRGRPKKEG